MKPLGYLISVISVLLLGAVAWNSASERPLLLTCLIAGMVTSIAGIGLRYLDYAREQRRKKSG